MNRKKIRRASSRRDAFSVIPRICNPFEWRDSLKILYFFCFVSHNRAGNGKEMKNSTVRNDDAAFYCFLSPKDSNQSNDSEHRQRCTFVLLLTRTEDQDVVCITQGMLLLEHGGQRDEEWNDGTQVDRVHGILPVGREIMFFFVSIILMILSCEQYCFSKCPASFPF